LNQAHAPEHFNKAAGESLEFAKAIEQEELALEACKLERMNALFNDCHSFQCQDLRKQPTKMQNIPDSCHAKQMVNTWEAQAKSKPVKTQS